MTAYKVPLNDNEPPCVHMPACSTLSALSAPDPAPLTRVITLSLKRMWFVKTKPEEIKNTAVQQGDLAPLL